MFLCHDYTDERDKGKQDQIEKMKNCFNCAEFEDNDGGLDNEVYVLCSMNPRPFDITTCKPICPKWRFNDE